MMFMVATLLYYYCVILILILASCSDAFSLISPSSSSSSSRRSLCRPSSFESPVRLASSFYGDFEDFDDQDDDDEDDDDDEEEEEELDDVTIADFRSRMGSLFGEGGAEDDGSSATDNNEGTISPVDELISYATGGSNEAPSNEWAIPTDKLEGGVVLVANPAKFCTDFGSSGDNKRRSSSSPSPALLQKFGLTLPPPADLGPDRRADLLPVLTLLEKHPLRGSQAVLLNRRTGYLLGDLEQPPPSGDDDGSVAASDVSTPKLGAFMIQPLWFGGTSAGGMMEGGGDGSSSGLDMLHLCPAVTGAKQITQDGLFWGGNPEQAQEAMNDPSLDRIMTGFDFKFFVQSTRWLPLQLEKEVREGTWFVATVSKEVLFKSRDRMGTRRAKPLWTEIMELMGGKYKAVRDQLYAE